MSITQWGMLLEVIGFFLIAFIVGLLFEGGRIEKFAKWLEATFTNLTGTKGIGPAFIDTKDSSKSVSLQRKEAVLFLAWIIVIFILKPSKKLFLNVLLFSLIFCLIFGWVKDISWLFWPAAVLICINVLIAIVVHALVTTGVTLNRQPIWRYPLLLFVDLTMYLSFLLTIIAFVPLLMTEITLWLSANLVAKSGSLRIVIIAFGAITGLTGLLIQFIASF